MKRKEAYAAFYPYFKPYRVRFSVACVFLALSYVVLFSSVGVMLSNVFSLVTEKESTILSSSLLYVLLVVLATVVSSRAFYVLQRWNMQFKMQYEKIFFLLMFMERKVRRVSILVKRF